MKREEEKKENVDKDRNSNNAELTVYNSRIHCKELFKEILKFHINDGFDNFEDLSYYIKKKFNSKKFQFTRQIKAPKNIIDLTKYEKNQLLEPTKKLKKKELETVNGYLDDLLNQFRMLEWAGISFNQAENYKLNISINVIIG